MDSSCTLDYATFQLSPRRSRCELFVSGNGKTEKLASGLLKPFLAHLKLAEEQAAKAVKSIKLDVEKRRNVATWFKKGTLERFVRFVSTPEVLELANTFDAEMSQLEGARRMYSEGAGDPFSATTGQNESATSASADVTKKELLKAIDLRLAAVKQDLTTACGRASSAGFTLDNVSELLQFADYFGANRLSEACTKFISLCQSRPDLVSHQQQLQSLPLQLKTFDDLNVRSSASSDMSIDEPEVETNAAGKLADSLIQPQKPNSSQLQQLNASELSGTSDQAKPMQRHSVDKPDEKATEGPATSVSAVKPAEQAGANSRRLSVQDRISLFESKQKEQSTNSSTVNNLGAANRVAGGRGELRRLSSDVSEKSVLRRWSGASDMSIDLHINNNSFGDRKASGSAASTPRASDLQNQFGSKTDNAEAAILMDNATSWPSVSSFSSSQVQSKGFPKETNHIDDNVVVGVIKTSMSQSKLALEKDTEHQSSVPKVKKETGGSGYQDVLRTDQTAETGDSLTTKEPIVQHVQSELDVRPKMKDPVPLRFRLDSVPDATEEMSIKKVGGQSPGVDGAGPEHQPPSVAQFRKFVRKIDSEVKAKGSADSQIQFKASSGTSMDNELSASSAQRRIIHGLQEDAVGRDTTASVEILGSWPAKAKEGSTRRIDLHHQTSTSNFVKKSQGRGDGVVDNEPVAGSMFPMNKVKEPTETPDQSSAWSVNNIQITRPSKGNQELNDELQIKANELEKLFAAHKLRIQNDQTTVSRRSKQADVKEIHIPKVEEKRQSVILPGSTFTMENSTVEIDFDANLPVNMVGSEQSSNISEKLVRFSPSDEFRGKCYDKYMQKRDAKLLEEWGSRKAEKEEKLKAMHDNLERTQAEIRIKFAGSADRNSHRRAEKLRSSSSRSSSRNKNKEDGDPEEVYEQVNHGKDASYIDMFDDSASKSLQRKKLSSAKNSSLATRTSAVSNSKSSTKSTNSFTLRHKTESPLAQSVPNFSDFRKENTKPSSATHRVSNRTQTRNFSHSKGITEEANVVKEDKKQRSLSTKTSSAGELKDLSTLNLDSIDLTSKICREQSDLLKFQKTMASGTLLRKDISTSPISLAGLVSPNGSLVSGVKRIVDSSEAIVHEDEDDWERISTEENLEPTTDFPLDSDSERTRKSKEFENSDDPVPENGDPHRYLIQAACGTADFSSKLTSSAQNGQESPGESSRSLNSHIPNSFSYVHDNSDIDAFVDSPIGSPASCNSNPLNQIVDGDAVRMRKKWGNAQIPVLVPNASQQSRKDVTKGFKRLLKFGRKNKAMENLGTDWVSSTASDGDDDTEDGSYIPTRPSDDSRKSRTGFVLPPEYAFKEGEMYSEQASRSFFSLSSFRSKGSESKHR